MRVLLVLSVLVNIVLAYRCMVLASCIDKALSLSVKIIEAVGLMLIKGASTEEVLVFLEEAHTVVEKKG